MRVCARCPLYQPSSTGFEYSLGEMQCLRIVKTITSKLVLFLYIIGGFTSTVVSSGGTTGVVV